MPLQFRIDDINQTPGADREMTIERNRKPNSRNHRTNQPVLAGILFFCCLLLAGTGFLYLRLGNGVQIKVSLDKNISPAAEIICYRQDDAQWGDDKLGSSSYTMRSSGCLVSCIAAALSMDRSTEETPGTLNRQFTSGQVYDAEGNLLWGRLSELGDYQVDVFSEISTDIIDTCLADGRYPIVRVRIHTLGSFHYVLIVGSQDGEYLCMDPLKDEIMPLSAYGRRVYGVRCVSTSSASTPAVPAY